MSFTLATLKTAVQDYLQVSESTFTTQLPRFIQESEDRIFSLVQLPDQRKNVQGNLTSGNRFLATPLFRLQTRFIYKRIFTRDHTRNAQVLFFV